MVTHIERSSIDLDLAQRQWDGYVAALHDEGWETIEVPAADDCPDAVFVEDTVVVYGDLAVISRPGAVERKPETAAVEELLAGLGYRIARIQDPGSLDGGDVLKQTAPCGSVSAAARTGPVSISSPQHWSRLVPGWSAYRSPRWCTEVRRHRAAGGPSGPPAAVDDQAHWREFLDLPGAGRTWCCSTNDRAMSTAHHARQS